MINENMIKVEVLHFQYSAFIESVKKCNVRDYKVKIIKEEKAEYNSWLITVEAEKAINLYHLGRIFGDLRSKI